ncbi:hypothetical protein B0H67DRAFT_280090 [Lasiosphaeris hirsuta]|uniref:Secreted protein n=1 Tax=Lasiosphaeris hirsuta TaxID=260670 RepID=A0AA40A8N4_9PEZI|nr:hypothetical protein B0H67DRAFT_280090 [Lasiosphaeris hirsuta]
MRESGSSLLSFSWLFFCLSLCRWVYLEENRARSSGNPAWNGSRKRKPKELLGVSTNTIFSWFLFFCPALAFEATGRSDMGCWWWSGQLHPVDLFTLSIPIPTSLPLNLERTESKDRQGLFFQRLLPASFPNTFTTTY